MRRVSANKNVLSSRLNSVRQMSCCRMSQFSEQADCSTAVVRRPQNFYRRASTTNNNKCCQTWGWQSSSFPAVQGNFWEVTEEASSYFRWHGLPHYHCKHCSFSFKSAEVRRAILSFSSWSSGGPDGMRSQHLKDLSCRESGTDF